MLLEPWEIIMDQKAVNRPPLFFMGQSSKGSGIFDPYPQVNRGKVKGVFGTGERREGTLLLFKTSSTNFLYTISFAFSYFLFLSISSKHTLNLKGTNLKRWGIQWVRNRPFLTTVVTYTYIHKIYCEKER